MNTTIRNPEFKSIIVKLLVLQIAFTFIFLIFIVFNLNIVNKNIVSNNTALIGKILYNHPEYEEETIKYVTKGATRDEIKFGRMVLSKYSYENNISDMVDASMNDSYNFFKIITTIFSLSYFIPLFILIYLGYSNIYKKIKEIYGASEKVMGGNFDVVLPEDREGEFGILGHTFNTMANRLKLSIEALNNDKVFLKNTISDISHQLKTPLSSLIAMNDIMIEDENMSNEDRKDFLQKSSLQLSKMEWLIMNLLKIARLEAGVIKFNKTKSLLINPVNNALISLKSMSDNKKINIFIEENDKEASFIGDENWTCEALVNIIKNSIEHTSFCGNIHIKLYETTIFSGIEIEDDGEGIGKDDLPHIFERFYKGNNSFKPQSIGIGLALSKLIIEGQEGTISVRSEAKKGTKFIITFLKGVI